MPGRSACAPCARCVDTAPVIRAALPEPSSTPSNTKTQRADVKHWPQTYRLTKINRPHNSIRGLFSVQFCEYGEGLGRLCVICIAV